MSTKSKIGQLAKTLDVRIEVSQGADEMYLFDAPPGFVFGCDGIHTLVHYWDREMPKREMWEDVADRLSYGLEPCEEPQCESCKGEADIRAGA